MKSETMLETAHHEAGHAVAAWFFGRELVSACLWSHTVPGLHGPELHHDGRIEFHSEFPMGKPGEKRRSGDDQVWKDELIIVWAGLVAQCHFRGKLCSELSTEDRNRLRELLDWVDWSSQSAREEAKNRAFESARKFVTEHWDLICDFAKFLDQNQGRKISAQEIMAHLPQR